MFARVLNTPLISVFVFSKINYGMVKHETLRLISNYKWVPHSRKNFASWENGELKKQKREPDIHCEQTCMNLLRLTFPVIWFIWCWHTLSLTFRKFWTIPIVWCQRYTYLSGLINKKVTWGNLALILVPSFKPCKGWCLKK